MGKLVAPPLSGFESRHLSEIQNVSNGVAHTLKPAKKIYKKVSQKYSLAYSLLFIVSVKPAQNKTKNLLGIQGHLSRTKREIVSSSFY